jgi:biopolymer transport protein ExbB/TolQ
VVSVAGLLFGPLYSAFLANPILNGLIFVVLLFGLGYVFRQVLMLRTEVNWIESFRRADPAISVVPPPNLLAPVASMLGERQGSISLSATATRSLLDSISARLEEGREISRYLIGLLIFLGLLGTFWGLLQTVSAVGSTISTLSPKGDDFVGFFNDLQKGLQAPLSGMGISFSSSLFGLAGSLVLGFLELQAGQAQGRFYMDFENWLSSHTRLSGGGFGLEAEQSVPAYVQALLEQTADSLDSLRRIIQRSEDGRASSQASLLQLSERLAELTDRMGREQDVLRRLAEASEKDRGGIDEASRNHLRNLDVYVTRLLEESTQGRHQLISELRSEIKLLARTIAALGEDRR